MMTMINDLSPQWFCANSYTWVHDVQLHVISTNELSKPSKERIISSHKWSTIRRVLKSHGSKMSIIYTCNHEKQCVTVRHIPACMSLPHNYCSDNGEGSLFSWLHVYIMSILLLTYMYVCIYYIYYIIYIHKYIWYCSYRKLVWVGFELTTTDFGLDALTDWAISSWV